VEEAGAVRQRLSRKCVCSRVVELRGTHNVTWDAVGAIGSFLSGLGLLAAAGSLWYLARSTRANEKATTAAVYQTIVALGYGVNEMMIAQPGLYEGIFPTDGEHQPAQTRPIRDDQDVRIEFAVRKWLDHFDMVMVLMESIPEGQRRYWEVWVRELLEKSPPMRGAVLREQWWPDHLKRAAIDAERRVSAR
jgi:hypothetical protein